MTAGAPIEGMSDRASLCLGLLILLALCAPLIVPILTTGRRGMHRPPRRRQALTVATTADPLALLGFMDRSGPPVFDVEAYPADQPAARHLSDAEIEAVAASLNALPDLDAEAIRQIQAPTPNADDVELWLKDTTERRLGQQRRDRIADGLDPGPLP